MPSKVNCTKSEKWMVLTTLSWYPPVFSLQNLYSLPISLSFLPLKMSSSFQEASQIVQQNSMWWPEAHLNFGGVGHHF